MTAWLERIGLFLHAPDMRPRAEIESDIADELAAHVALRTLENERAGMPPDEALRDAERRLGDRRRIVAECRDIQMKERIMLQRINVLLIAVLALGMALNLWVGASAQEAVRADMEGLRNDVAVLAGAVRTARTEPSTATPPLQLAAQMPEVYLAYGDRALEETRRVHVLGKVGRPGPVVYRKGLTLSMALAECGGLAEFADAGGIRIVRERGDVVTVDLGPLLAGRADGADSPEARKRIEDPELRPGDRIIVPEAFF